MKEWAGGHCLYIWCHLCDTIYHFIAANKVLLKKNYYSSYKCCYFNHPQLLTFVFFQEIFNKSRQTIHEYCFKQYKKYLCKIFSLWTYPLQLITGVWLCMKNKSDWLLILIAKHACEVPDYYLNLIMNYINI